MAISVNDGTAKWQLIKYSEADTLGGLTASEIKSQAISGKTVQVKGQGGTFTLRTDGNRSFTIPLPSGYTRSQCMYVVSREQDRTVAGGESSVVYATIEVTPSSVNQSTGVVTSTVGGTRPDSRTATITPFYYIVAAK